MVMPDTDMTKIPFDEINEWARKSVRLGVIASAEFDHELKILTIRVDKLINGRRAGGGFYLRYIELGSGVWRSFVAMGLLEQRRSFSLLEGFQE